jgi:hypothetical protein
MVQGKRETCTQHRIAHTNTVQYSALLAGLCEVHIHEVLTAKRKRENAANAKPAFMVWRGWENKPNARTTSFKYLIGGFLGR